MLMVRDENSAVGRLKGLGVRRGILLQMAERGQIVDVQCEMPFCYCPRGRREFDERAKPMPDWALNLDHHPLLRSRGGTLTPGNVRMAHVFCNRTKDGFRARVIPMLERGLSLAEIAARLDSRKIRPPHGHPRWTPALVRKAFVS
jgi:hypothetical protein